MFELVEINVFYVEILIICSLGDLYRFVARSANARSWSEISLELTTEVVETNFEVDGVMMRSSKEDLVWCESCRVGELMCCLKQVEFSKSRRPDRCLSGWARCLADCSRQRCVFQIIIIIIITIRQSAASVPRVARSEPNFSRNTDLLDEGGGIC